MTTVKCDWITCDYNKKGYCTKTEILLTSSSVVRNGEFDEDFYCADWTMNAREARE